MVSLILEGVKLIGSLAKGWLNKKKAKQDGEIKIATAKAEAQAEDLKEKRANDFAWENTALANAGIKDEIMMLVILVPMVCCFIPPLRPWIRDGFLTMKEVLPSYWEYAFYTIIGVSFGVRKWIDFMQIKKGK